MILFDVLEGNSLDEGCIISHTRIVSVLSDAINEVQASRIKHI